MAKIAPFGKYRAFDNNGDPLAGGKLYTYIDDTTTPKDTYTTQEGDVANTNPVIMDANGEADVWLDAGSYKFVLKDSADVTQWTTDEILGSSTGGYASVVIEQATNLVLTSVYQNYLIDCTASLTISLLAATSAGDGFLFTVKNTSAGNLTIDPDSAELIDGAATLVLPPNSSANIVCDGTGWKSFSAVTVNLGLVNAFTGNNSFAAKLSTPNAGTLTIATGAVTATGAFHIVDTEAAAASDDLDTISGGIDGQVLIIRQSNDARDVTLTEAGNIVLPNSNSIALNDTKESVTLIYDSTLVKWVLISAPSAPAAGLVLVDTLTVSTPVTSVEFVNKLTDTYDNYVIYCDGVTFSAQDQLSFRVGDATPTYKSDTKYHRALVTLAVGGSPGSSGDNAADIAIVSPPGGDVGIGTSEVIYANIYINGARNTSSPTGGWSWGVDAGSSVQTYQGVWSYVPVSGFTVESIQLRPYDVGAAGVTINAGEFKLYGIL